MRPKSTDVLTSITCIDSADSIDMLHLKPRDSIWRLIIWLFVFFSLLDVTDVFALVCANEFGQTRITYELNSIYFIQISPCTTHGSVYVLVNHCNLFRVHDLCTSSHFWSPAPGTPHAHSDSALTRFLLPTRVVCSSTLLALAWLGAGVAWRPAEEK